jgi:predicted secreted protein
VNWFTGCVLYVIVWWTTLFAVLPIGVRPIAAADERTGWRGTPDRPRIATKALVTTVVAAAIWALLYLLITSSWLSFRQGWLSLPPD